MTVIFRCKPKVSAALCCISCLFHRSQHQSADHHFIRHSLNLLKNLLNFLWCDFLTCFLHLNPLMSQKRKKAFHSFRIRIVMRTVNKRIFSLAVFFCHCFICHQHKIFYDLCSNILFVWLHINCPSCPVQNDLAFRKIEINRTSVMSLASQKCR